MADAPPEKIQALVADGKGGASVQTVPLPKLKEGEILVKVDYVALVSAP
jgi:NADPH:quinone reductase-like Zn-dependent oxidoreductase